MVKSPSDKLCALLTELSFTVFKSSFLTGNFQASTPKKINKSPKRLKLTENMDDSSILERVLRILSIVFVSSKSHRAYIIQDVLSYVAFCSSQMTSKISLSVLFGRNAVSPNCEKLICPASGVIVSLVQSLVKVDGFEQCLRQSNGEQLETVAKSMLMDSNAVASFLIAEITRRCRNKDTGADYRTGLNVIIHDVLNLDDQMTLPAASLILTSFVRRSTLDISDGTTLSDKSDISYILFLVDILGGVGSRIRETLKLSVETPITIDEASKCVLKQTWNILKLDSQLKCLKPTTTIQTRTSKSRHPRKQNHVPESNHHHISMELAMHLYSLLANIVLEVTCEKIVTLPEKKQFEEIRTCLNFDEEADVTLDGELSEKAERKLPTFQPQFFEKYLHGEPFVVPDFSVLLKACDLSNEQLSIFPQLKCSDLHHYWFMNYLVARFECQDHQHPGDASNCYLGSMILNTGLWMMSNIRNKLVQISEFAFRILVHFLHHQMDSQRFLKISDPREAYFLQFKPTSTFQSFEWASYCYSHIQRTSRFLQNDFFAIQKSLIILFSHPSPQIRARVVRSLNLLVKVDPTLFENSAWKTSVIERFNDVAISVREEVVKLVGGYILEPRQNGGNFEDHNQNYLSALLVRLRDKGVSVRKSVVNIFRDVLLHQPHHPRYSEICLRLLERSMNPKEEDTLKDGIQHTFQQVWFNPAPSDAVQSNALWSILSTPTKMRKMGRTLESISPVKSSIEQHNDKSTTPSRTTVKTVALEHIEATATQIVDVVDYSLKSGGDADWLIKLIRDVLHGTDNPAEVTSQTKKRQMGAFHHCEKLIDCLLNLLFSLEKSVQEKVEDQSMRSPQETVVAIFVTISCFCKAHPPYVIRHIHTLLPYLKGENGLTMTQDSILCYHLMQMISLSLEIPIQLSVQDEIHLAGGFDASPLGVTQLGIWNNRVEEISTDLVRIALNYPILTVQPAVECLSQLATHVCHHGSYLLQLAQKCFNSISWVATNFSVIDISAPGINHIELNSTHIARIQRSIVVLGAICEQTNKCTYLRETVSSETSRICRSILSGSSNNLLKSISENALNSSCYVCVKFCLSLDHENIQARAAQGLCSVFVGCPNLILEAEKDGILQWLIGQSSSSVISKTLQSLNKVLLEEERRLEIGASIDQLIGSGSTIGSRVQGNDVGADGTITGNVLRRHLSSLLDLMTQNLDNSVRLNALTLIGTLLNHGMVHPMDVFSPIIGMLGDECDSIRQAALTLLIEQDERCSIFLDNRIIDGLENSYRIQMEKFGTSYPLLACDLDSEQTILCSVDGNTVDGSRIPSNLKRTSLISSLYASCYRGNKRRRMDLIVALLRRCELHCQRIATARARIITSTNDTHLQRFLLCHLNEESKQTQAKLPSTPTILTTSIKSFEIASFLSAVLASLPFCWVDEPLSAIYWISRNSNVASSIYEKLFRSCLLEIFASEYVVPMIDHKLKTKSIPRIDEIDPTLHLYEDHLLVLKENILPNFLENDEDIALITLLTVEGMSRILLSRLKLYFKSTFSLSDERCLSFTPSYDKEVAEGTPQRTAQLPLNEKDKDCHRDSKYALLPEYLHPKFYYSDYSSRNDFLKSSIKVYNCLYALVHGDGNDLTLVPKKSNSSKESRRSAKAKPNKSVKKGSSEVTTQNSRTSKRRRKSSTRFGDAGTLNSDDENEYFDDNDSEYEEV